MTRKANKTSWKPGQSGNPKGCPPGGGELGKLRAQISEQVPGILVKLIAQAKAGDTQAARLLLERTLPPIKPQEQVTPLTLPDSTLTDQGRAILAAVAAGQLAPGAGAQLVAAVGQLAKIAEIDELERRIAALEKAREPRETA